MYTRLARGLMKALPELNELRKGVKAGALSSRFDLTDGVQAAMDVERWTADTGKPASELLKGAGMAAGEPALELSERQKVLAEFFLAHQDEPDALKASLQEIVAKAQAGGGPEPDPVIDAIDILKRRPKSKPQMQLDLDMSAEKRAIEFDGPEAESFGDETLGDILRGTKSEQPIHGMVGSESSGRMGPGDIEAFEATRTAQKAAAEGTDIDPSMTFADIYGEGASPVTRAAFRENFQQAIDILNTGKSDIETHFMPNLRDYATNATGVGFGQAVRDADPHLPNSPIWSKDLVWSLGAGDAHAEDWARALLSEVKNMAQGKPAGKIKPARKFKSSIPHPAEGGEPPLFPRAEGPPTGEIPPSLDRPPGNLPPAPPPPDVPVPPGGKFNLWELMKDSLLPALDPEYALPAPVWQGVRKSMNMIHDFQAGWADHFRGTFKGIHKGSPEDNYMGMFLDLTDEHMGDATRALNRTLKDLKKAKSKKSAAFQSSMADDPFFKFEEDLVGHTLTGKIDDLEAEERARRHYMGWLRESQTKMFEYAKTIPTEKLAMLQERAGHIRRAYDTAGFLLREAKYPGFENFGETSGRPLSYYFTHIIQRDEYRPRKFQSPADTMHEIPNPNVFAPFLLPRAGVPGYSFSAIGATSSYFPTLGKKLFLEPVLQSITPGQTLDEAVKMVTKELNLTRILSDPEDLNPITRNLSVSQKEYLVRWINAIRGHPGSLDNYVQNALISTAGRARHMANSTKKRALRKTLNSFADGLAHMAENPTPAMTTSLALEKAIVMGTLGGNMGFMLKNLTQPVASTAKTSVHAWLAGLRSFNTREGVQLAWDAGFTREFQRYVENAPELYGTMKQISPFLDSSPVRFAKAGKRIMEQVVLAPGAYSEFTNRGVSVMTGVSHEFAKRGIKTVGEAVKKGEWEEILAEGIKLSDQVNFVYGVAGRSPYITKNPILRLGLQFTQYNHKMYQMLSDWAFKQKAVTPLLSYIAMTGYMTALASRGGSDISSWMGLPGLDPRELVLNKEGGVWPIQTVAAQGIQSLIAYFSARHEGKPYAMKKAQREFLETALIITIPAYVQMRKAQRGLDAWADGYFTNTRQERVRKNKKQLPDLLEAFATGFPHKETSARRRMEGVVRKSDAERGLLREEATDTIVDLMIKMDKTKDPELLAGFSKEYDEAIDGAIQAGVNMESLDSGIAERYYNRTGEDYLGWQQKLVRRYPELFDRLQKTYQIE